MTNPYTTSHPAHIWRKLALAALLATGATAAQAQVLNYPATGAQNLVTTFTDLGTTGTVIATPNTDDANSAATPIGFTFNYNGTAFTDFVLNTNGFLKLGTTAPAVPYFSNGSQDATGGPLNAAGETNLLLPFNDDLMDATAGTAEYRVVTTGTAPNRVCTIQWKNVKDKGRAASPTIATVVGNQLDNFSFQVKLYETTNIVDFVYGSAIAGAGPDGAKFVVVGAKGSGSAANQAVVATKGSTGAWGVTTFGGNVYTTAVNAHNVRSTVRPDAGRTYRFLPLFANDASVAAIYTLGKLPTTIATPHVIQAVVRNIGSAALTNISVKATVAGANAFTNTKTIATLAPNASATVSFDGFTPTVIGNETVTVNIESADDYAGNNTRTYVQQVTNGAYAVAEPGVAPNSSIGFGASATGNILAVKYNTNTARQVTAVTTRLADVASVGKVIYAVVANSVGAIVGRTPDYTVVAADINTDKVFTLAAPASITTGDFYAGIAQTASTAAHFPIGTQAENPTRAGAFYSIPLAGGAPNDQVAGNLGRIMIEATTAAPATCSNPTAVTVTSSSPTTATVTFTGPANGTGYTIVYGPVGFNPATGGTTVTSATSPYTITGLTASTDYDVYIRSNCGTTDQSGLFGPIKVTTQCSVTAVTTFPYTESFNTTAAGAVPCGYTINDTNGDTFTWATTATVGTAALGSNAMVYIYNEASDANDWFFTSPLLLRTGTRYQLSFRYRAGLAAFPERLEVKYGSAATPAAQTNLLWNNAVVSNTAYATANATSTIPVLGITPATTGNYYIGFHAYSLADQFFLAVDDVQITATAITGTSAALDYAISVFPNPSAGIFNLDIKGANAKGAMQVEVVNSLGQIVYTTSVRDNQLNKLDLSNLAGGMYVLKVKSGNDFSVRNISVQK